MATGALNLPLDRIAAISRKYGVEELSLFGSILREDFDADSDVDFLVVFKKDEYGPWMGKLTGMEAELSELIGRKADLVPKKMLKPLIRDRVLASFRVIYADG